MGNESGYAEAHFLNGAVRKGRFSTVWKLQDDGLENLSQRLVADGSLIIGSPTHIKVIYDRSAQIYPNLDCNADGRNREREHNVAAEFAKKNRGC